MTGPARREEGFTLISVMVAVVMLTIGLLALARVQTSLVRTQRDTAVRTKALVIARSYTEDLRSRDPWTLVSEAPVTVDDLGVPNGSGVYTRSTTVVADQTNLVRIVVQVDYPGETQPVQLVTMAYRGVT